ncbi:hypothetical protein JCM19297_1594 [Nonlabens ulvanivorans]|nr:hypothetical protein JCM19297_1594 [Nonlabens ulvanivorans]
MLKLYFIDKKTAFHRLLITLSRKRNQIDLPKRDKDFIIS